MKKKPISKEKRDALIKKLNALGVRDITKEMKGQTLIGFPGMVYKRIRNTMKTKPNIKVAPGVKLDTAVKSYPKEECQVILRLRYEAWARIRIWPTTYLICNQTGNRSKLMHSMNVAKYPDWSYLSPFDQFLLVFEALPQNCLSFDFYEDIPEASEFHEKGIARNKTDVYDLVLQ